MIAAATEHSNDGVRPLHSELDEGHRDCPRRGKEIDRFSMRSAVSVIPSIAPLARFHFADCLELVRPRIAVMILLAEAAGFVLASRGAPDMSRLAHTLLGTLLVVAGASALNQVFEQHSDALMERTVNRPLPGNRLKPGAAALFGVCLAVCGLAYLALVVRQPVAVMTATLAFGSYVFIYTPLKRATTLNTLVGAIPGALPPVIGWAAVTNRVDPGAGMLFAILFLWQVPHFLAIAWIYRDDYRRAGMQVLPTIDRSGERTARCMTGHCVALLLVSVVPVVVGWAGPFYLMCAVVLGGEFLVSALWFFHNRSISRAREVLRTSLFYLPTVLLALVVDTTYGSAFY
jgi:protoheme IX farnesyltransferase